MKFGQPDQSSIIIDNVEIAKNKYTKPRLKNQKSFDMYVERNIDSFESQTGSIQATNIIKRSLSRL